MICHRLFDKKTQTLLVGQALGGAHTGLVYLRDLGCHAEHSKDPTVTVGNQQIRMGKRAASKTGALTRATVKARGEWAVIALTRK